MIVVVYIVYTVIALLCVFGSIKVYELAMTYEKKALATLIGYSFFAFLFFVIIPLLDKLFNTIGFTLR